MSAATKAFSIVLLFVTAIGLAVVYQPALQEPISVSVTTSTHGVKHEDTIVLKAALNGNGLSHGEVRLDFTRTSLADVVSSSDSKHSIKGYTDGRGLFITTGPPYPPGEYMITASVSKTGCIDGRSVCFVRVPEPRREPRRLAEHPISVTWSNRLER